MYTLPVPPFVPNTVISSSAVNSDLSDIATALTDSLARDGQGAMTGAFLAIDGTIGAPGIAFGADPNTGIRRTGADAMAATVGGVDALSITGTGVGLPLGGTVTGLLAITGTQTITATVAPALSITSSAAGTLLSITSTDAGAAAGPDIVLDRNSASPAANDIIGKVVMRGRDSAANLTDYIVWTSQILDPTNGSQDSRQYLTVFVNGSASDVLTIGPGVRVGAPAGGDLGVGTINCTGIFVNGGPVGQTITFSADKGGAGSDTLTSGAVVQITFGTENWDIGNAYAANAWTPPAGKYQIYANVNVSNTNAVANEALVIILRKNGADHRSVNYTRTSTSAVSLTIFAIVDANGTDAFTVHIQKNGAGNGSTGTSAGANYFQGSAL